MESAPAAARRLPAWPDGRARAGIGLGGKIFRAACNRRRNNICSVAAAKEEEGEGKSRKEAGGEKLDRPPTRLPHAGLSWPKRHDLAKIGGLGVCLFLSQLFYITGIELSGVVVATCMQVGGWACGGRPAAAAVPPSPLAIFPLGTFPWAER